MADGGAKGVAVRLQDEQVLLRPLLAGCTADRTVPVLRILDPGSADSLVCKQDDDQATDVDKTAAAADAAAGTTVAAPADDADSDGSSVYSDAEVVEPALWAYCWSCNVFLSELLLAVDQRVLRGMPTMEFGCGSGFLGVVAALAGCPSVVCTDYIDAGFPAVLKTAEANAVLAQPGAPAGVSTALLDWNDLPTATKSLAGAGQFRLVVGSDVLYLPESAEPVSELLWSMLAPGGCALIADPARAAGYSFTQLFLLPERSTSASTRGRRRRRKATQAAAAAAAEAAADEGEGLGRDPFEAAPAATILRGSCFLAFPTKGAAPATKQRGKKKVTTHASDGTADGLYLRVLEAKHVASRSGTAVEQLRLFWVCKRQRTAGRLPVAEEPAVDGVAGWVEGRDASPGGTGVVPDASAGLGEQEEVLRHSMAVLRAMERGMEVLSRERKVKPPDNSAIYPPGSRQAAQAVLDGLPERLLRPEGSALAPPSAGAASAGGGGANYSPALFGGEANDL